MRSKEASDREEGGADTGATSTSQVDSVNDRRERSSRRVKELSND